jgi:methylglutaconyl-CoA hydratase
MQQHLARGARLCARMPPARRLSLATDFKYLQLEQRNGDSSLRIVMNRPQLHNSFNEELIGELSRAFKAITPQDCRSVVLTGAGKSFSAGADLNWMKKMAQASEQENKEDSLRLFDMFHAIRACPVPVIARVNGAALGGGSGLVAACDMVFAVSSAVFGFTEVRLGIIPAVISPFVLEKIGYSNCARWFFTGARFSAATAHEIGLVQGHYATEQLLEEAVDTVTQSIAQSGPSAVAACKDLLRSISVKKIGDVRETVAAAIAKARVSAEGQEGMAAFFDKRSPSWAAKPKL